MRVRYVFASGRELDAVLLRDLPLSAFVQAIDAIPGLEAVELLDTHMED